MRIPIAPQGYPFIFGILTITGLLWWFTSCGEDGTYIYTSIGGLLSAFVINFFRDPCRNTPEGEDVITSPADGKVIKVEKFIDERFLNCEVMRVCIFMNVFDVHVNRAPLAGKVTKMIYNEGKFFPADRDKASLENEQNAVFIETESGLTVVANQIAGLVARRIVPYVKKGDSLRKGERFGMIRFGSRVDLYLPPNTEIDVKVGDKVKAGINIIGRLK